MPMQAQQADNEHTRLLIAEYERLELVLLEDIARRLRRNESAPDWVSQRLNEITELKKAAAAHIATMVEKLPRGADDAIDRAAKDGVAEANRDIDAVEKKTGAGRMLLNGGGTALATDTRALALLHHEANFALNALNTGILRGVEDLYRKVVSQTVPTVISGVETRVQSTQRALDEYAKHGIKGFKDKGGRTWSMTAYAEMATRTAATRALTQSHMDRLAQRGYDLVVISSHPRPAPQCQPYEKQVLSLSGMNSGRVEVEDSLTGRMTSVRVKASVETAMGRGLFHPNCRHTSGIWLPGVSDTTPTEANDEGYEDTQKLRYLERQTRDWKRRSATALTPDAKRRADAKVKDWQKQIRDHVDETGVGRRRDREQITGVYGPGNATRANASTTNIPRTTQQPDTNPTVDATPGTAPTAPARREPLPGVRRKSEEQLARSSRQTDLADTNPKFETDRNYQINCQRCVMANELRIRGYDVTARPHRPDFDIPVSDVAILGYWTDPLTGASRPFQKIDGREQADAAIAEWGDGARGWVTVDWKSAATGAPGAGGHIFSTRVIDGRVVYDDPQNGRSDVGYYFDHAKPTIQVVRVDDQLPTYDVTDMIDDGKNDR